MTKDPELVCIQRCYGLDVAEIYKGKLEALGIPALLEYDSAAKLFGLTVDGLGEVRVMVPAPYAAEAEALLVGPDEEDSTEESAPSSADSFPEIVLLVISIEESM